MHVCVVCLYVLRCDISSHVLMYADRLHVGLCLCVLYVVVGDVYVSILEHYVCTNVQCFDISSNYFEQESQKNIPSVIIHTTCLIMLL